jgi:hypothetical protein
MKPIPIVEEQLAQFGAPTLGKIIYDHSGAVAIAI